MEKNLDSFPLYIVENVKEMQFNAIDDDDDRNK